MNKNESENTENTEEIYIEKGILEYNSVKYNADMKVQINVISFTNTDNQNLILNLLFNKIDIFACDKETNHILFTIEVNDATNIIKFFPTKKERLLITFKKLQHFNQISTENEFEDEPTGDNELYTIDDFTK